MTGLIIREMKEGEQKTLIRVAKRAFKFFEGLFIESPQKAMVAEHEGRIVGGIMYRSVNVRQKKMVYISEAFVDPDYHGKGVGKKLYEETFRFIWKQGCDGMSALVKDDNTASFKLFMNNGFKRVSFPEAVKHIGAAGFIKQYFLTPFAYATGMDFYINMRAGEVREKEKSGGISQLAAFFLANILLIFPMWLPVFGGDRTKLLPSLLAYMTILALFSLPRGMGVLFCREKFFTEKCRLRFNNGGGMITLLLSLWGNTFPMNINWYPLKYEDSEEFRRKLAIPEIIKWCIFILLPFLSFTQNDYLRVVAEISCYYLVLMILPFYPCEALGAGRIYRYSRKLWMLSAVVTIMELIVLSRVTG